MKAWARGGALFFLSLFLLDALLFRWVLFAIPATFAWDTRPHHLMERQIRALPVRPAVLILGSSVARYGFLEEALLPEAPEKIYNLGRRGLNPLELEALARRISEKTRPGWIVLPVHPVDFRLERSLSVKPEDAGSDLYSLSALREIYPPAGLVRGAPFQGKAGFLLALVCAGCRFGRIAWEGLAARLSQAGISKSYHYYAGLSGSGIFRRGWTLQKFSLPASANLLAGRLDVQALQAQELYISQGRMSQTIKLTKGWNRIALIDFSSGPDAPPLLFRASHCSYSEAEAACISLRLSPYAGLGKETGRAAFPERRPVAEDELYASFADEVYKKSYMLRLARYERPGMEYLHGIALARKRLAREKFSAATPAFQAFLRAVLRLKQIAPVVLINAPENPLADPGDAFKNSEWYRGYLAFLRQQSPCFSDQSKGFAMQEFYDSHHLTYAGARAQSQRIQPLLKDCPRNNL